MLSKIFHDTIFRAFPKSLSGIQGIAISLNSVYAQFPRHTWLKTDNKPPLINLLCNKLLSGNSFILIFYGSMEHTTSKWSHLKVWSKNAVIFSRFEMREILVGHRVPSDNLFWHTVRGWTEIHLLTDAGKEEGSPRATALCCSCPPHHQPATCFPALQQHPVLNLNHGIQTKRVPHRRYVCPSHIFPPFYPWKLNY